MNEYLHYNLTGITKVHWISIAYLIYLLQELLIFPVTFFKTPHFFIVYD